MTDKQIIIDGVDVSGCVQFIQEEKDCCDLGGNCKGWTNCYYKQLKRKEQECEELKIYIESNEQQVKEVETLVMDNDRLINELDQLKAENEELKKANIYIDNNRMVKADKLKRIEDLIIACSSGYTDEFIQELLVILHEPEPIKE